MNVNDFNFFTDEKQNNSFDNTVTPPKTSLVQIVRHLITAHLGYDNDSFFLVS